MARIAIVCEPPDGGVAEHVRRLALGLPAHGHDPLLLVADEFAHRGELARAGVELRALPLRRDYGHPRDDLRALVALVPLLRGADLVHGHSAKAGVLARLAAVATRRPVAYTPHGFPFVGEMGTARQRFGVVVERALAPPTGTLICVCQFERELARANGLRPRRIAVVHNGCPRLGVSQETVPGPPSALGERVAAAPELAALRAAGTGSIVGAVSTLRPAKRLDVLLDAIPAVLAAVPDARFVIAGEGPLERELHAQAARLGIEGAVTWLPFVAPAARYLLGLDVYVLSSGWEAFPIGPLEALAAGVPQVVSGVGGTRESVVPETGIVVPPRDPPALAAALVELLHDPARREAMARASRERHARLFTVDRMVAGTAAVYDELLTRRARAAPARR